VVRHHVDGLEGKVVPRRDGVVCPAEEGTKILGDERADGDPRGHKHRLRLDQRIDRA
jgi:hypothetical protein